MAGITRAGFVPETFEAIKSRIEGKLEVYNAGFDFSPESPDGQLINIMSFEVFQLWSQLKSVYESYNPNIANGAALRNIGQITGLPFGVADRSYATCEVTGTAGTIIPQGTIVVDNDGNEFYTAFETAIPSNIQVVAVVAGPISVNAGSIASIQTPLAGWDSVSQSTDGTVGRLPQTEQEYRNTRSRTVLRNYTSTADTMQARLIELGLGQALVIENDDTSPVGGVPANTIHVTVGELGDIPPQTVARIILETKPLGCPTFGNSSEIVKDSQGVEHTINFSVASAININIDLDVTFLSDLNAGAAGSIKEALLEHINSLASGEDVIWSRLFGYITPYAKAQVNTLNIYKDGETPSASNIVINEQEFATMTEANINLVVT